MKKTLFISLSAIILIAVAGMSFYGGFLYGITSGEQSISFNRNVKNLTTNISPKNKQNNGNIGEIISKDDKSITIKNYKRRFKNHFSFRFNRNN